MKFCALLKNEFTKIFKRRAVLVFFVLIIINCFIAGLNLYESDIVPGYGFSLQNEYNNLLRKADTLESRKEEYLHQLSPDEVSGESSSQPGFFADRQALIKKYNDTRFELLKVNAQASVYKEALEFDITSRDDWRYSVLFDIINGEIKAACCDEILKAKPEDEDYILTVICPYLEIGAKFSLSDIKEKLEAHKKNISTLWSGIRESNYALYCKQQVTALQYDQAAKLADLEMIKRQLKDNPSSTELAAAKRKAEGTKSALEGKIEIQSYRYHNKIQFGSKIDKTLDIMLKKYDDYTEKVNSLVTKEYFHKNAQYYEWAYSDYEEYEQKQRNELRKDLDAVKIGWYSIEYGVDEMSVADSARANMLGFTNMFVFFSAFAIIISALCIAGEHVTRSVYLLLIRPAKRYKILLSKYIAVIVSALILIVLSFGAYLCATLIIYGANDLSFPYLYVQSGTVMQTPFLGWLFLRVIYASLSVIFLATVTFAASVVMRSIAFSTAFGLFTYFSSVIFTAVFGASTLYGYMPFPYFNIASFVFNDAVSLTAKFGPKLFGSVSVYPIYGFIWLTALMIINLAVAFITFSKRDVTNT